MFLKRLNVDFVLRGEHAQLMENCIDALDFIRVQTLFFNTLTKISASLTAIKLLFFMISLFIACYRTTITGQGAQ
jgi:hypothetical protein